MDCFREQLFFPNDRALHIPAKIYWRENIIQRHFGLDCRFHEQRPFQAELRAWELGEVRLIRMNLDGLTVLSERQIAPRVPHEHVYLKLIVAGKVNFEQPDGSLPVGSGAMVFVDPVHPFSESFVALTQLVLLMLPKRELRNRGLMAEVDRPLVLDASSPENNALWHLLLTITQHAENTTVQFRERLGAQVMNLIDFVACTTTRGASSRTSAATRARIKWYLREHLGDYTLDTAAIADAMRLSPRRINRLFAAEGTSLMRHLWTCRLERAHEMLDAAGTGGLRIEEVAWRCGFSDPTHFSRSFKARYGCSPRDFRRAAQSKAPSVDRTG